MPLSGDASEIVGESDVVTASGVALFRALLCKKGIMINLGTVADDACSAALSISSLSQNVVFGAADCYHEDHAFLWENGKPDDDLSTLVSAGSDLTLIEAIPSMIEARLPLSVSSRMAMSTHSF